jgi:hypothetical protein
MTRSSATDHAHAGVGEIRDGDTAEEVLVCAMVAVVIAAVGTWLTGQFAAFMFMGAWPRVSLAEALQVTFRLPWHLADPRGAWPAAVQGELPGTAAFYVAAMTALGILGFGTAAVVRWAARQVLGQRPPVPQGPPATGLVELAVRDSQVKAVPPELPGRPPTKTTLR